MSDATRGPGAGDVDPGELRPGRRFAGHVIEAEIGRGGMGVVYRARNIALERERALKVIAPALSADPAFRERFRRESRLAAQVEHPNVVPVHDAGEEEGRLYIAMRLVDGEDLRATVEREGALQPARVAALIAGVAEGLDAAHDRGLVHRDVKPSNILIESGRAGERAFLTDFGISRSVGSDSSLTSAKVFLGSVDYVAPEQVEGEPVDSRADVYALGGVAYFALTGQPPYRRDTDLAKLFAHANAAPPRPSDAASDLPAAVDDVIARAMAKKPGERYAAARDFASDLQAAVGGEPIAPAPKPQPAVRSEATTSRIGLLRRHRGIAAGAGALVLAGAAVAALALAGGGGGNQAGPAGTLAGVVRVGTSPGAITVGMGRVWVADHGSGDISSFPLNDPKHAVTAVHVGGKPNSVATGFGYAWATRDDANALYRITPRTGAVTRIRLGAGTAPSDVDVSKNWVWVAESGTAGVARIDPGDLTATPRIALVGEGPRALAIGGGPVWVVNQLDHSASKIAEATADTIGKPFDGVGQIPTDIAVGAGGVWVVDNFNGTLVRIDPHAATVGAPIEVGAKPRGVAVGLGSVWVANGGDSTVTRIDPSTEQQIGSPVQLAPGSNPAEVTTGGGYVWTANFSANTVSRIKP